jgi:hypothetical protein
MSVISEALYSDSMRGLASSAASLASWRTLALILAIINLKNLPFAWHVRVNALPIDSIKFGSYEIRHA